ncbi:hypothetical protein [Micromonospora sp. WMMD1082]|uniref:hypothetical protein n=1 Tax=Micromonospora sp. WMMD1082 TaxID=3016104 RepID=UPI002416C5B9|nr:hypothetical protein [Micromonospora sp. WMMD1082]MDG4793747.1 hypothetical protein [Micromonospora sp. WMMD1082]
MSQLGAGDLLRLGQAASVQFRRPILFRLIRELDWTTYDGWVWLDGYQLDSQGQAVARRSLFVQRAGITLVRAAPRPLPYRPPQLTPTRRQGATQRQGAIQR